MHVTVDQNRCCGAGQCVMTAPAVFDQSEDDGLVRLRHEHPDASLAEQVRLAATLCPGRAITLREQPA